MTEKAPTKAELTKQLEELESRLAEVVGERDSYLDDVRRVAA